MRNICSKCGCDSNGTGASGAGYIATAPGDSSGVYPNITFEVDGVDYYTTGNLRYSGQWVKKGFTFLTGPAQTSFTLKFFNNAPGGGGNDWALDDITVATCTPNLQLNPSADPTVCENNLVTMSCTVRSFFNNYTYYKWQRSTNNGVTWNDTGISGGPVTPTWNGTAWEYTATYPPYVGTTADSGYRYRVVVATTAANLNNTSCAFSETTVITVHVINCGDPLETDILSFAGKVENRYGVLNWSTTQENEQVTFTIEKSGDGINFIPIGTVDGTDQNGGINIFSFKDPQILIGTQHYRLKLTANGKVKYSRTVQLSADSKGIEFISVINPFHHALSFEVASDATAIADVDMIDGAGEIIRKLKFTLQVGQNSFSINDTDNLPAGIYTLRVRTASHSIHKRVVKQ